MTDQVLKPSFFQQEPQKLAVSLLGKVLRRHYVDNQLGSIWLAAQIIETEAYYLSDKASHSSLGFTQKRAAMFMEPGTIYMYYARGADSLNFSARGRGNAVLIKSAYPYVDDISPEANIRVMQKLNPLSKSTANPSDEGVRAVARLCAGQTLLCRSLNLKVADWDQQKVDSAEFYVEHTSYNPDSYIQCARLGITKGRDEHQLYRFIDEKFLKFTTSNPLRKRKAVAGEDYLIKHCLPGRAELSSRPN